MGAVQCQCCGNPDDTKKSARMAEGTGLFQARPVNSPKPLSERCDFLEEEGPADCTEQDDALSAVQQWQPHWDPAKPGARSNELLATVALDIQRQLELQDQIIRRLLEESDAAEARQNGEDDRAFVQAPPTMSGPLSPRGLTTPTSTWATSEITSSQGSQ